MRTCTLSWNTAGAWSATPDLVAAPHVILCFADRAHLGEGSPVLASLQARHPSALLLSCSTAGEICGAQVSTGGACALLLRFDQAWAHAARVPLAIGDDGAQAGAAVAKMLPAEGLRHVLLFSDGLYLNGSKLVGGVRAALPPGVRVTGGLAGDGALFSETRVGLGLHCAPRQVVALGLYGASLQVAWGSAGGWQPFGPKRLITAASGNILRTLDDQPALALYKRYLGPRAADLPASGLLFPLQILSGDGSSDGVVRTILAVDEQEQSLTFAGEMPVGAYARLMKAGSDALVDGAGQAALQTDCLSWTGETAAILVSCVGRRLVLGQSVEDEVDAVLARLNGNRSVAGFYSYGELCPSGPAKPCALHNQTMTLTVIGETLP